MAAPAPAAPFRLEFYEESEYASLPALEIVPFPLVSDLPVYDIRNGVPEDIVPYLQRSSIASHHQWVHVRGMPTQAALNHTDAFVRAHHWNILRTAPTTMTPAQRRRAALVLGVTRAVMTANYNLTEASLVNGELAEAPLAYMPPAAEGGAAKIVIVAKAPTAPAGQAVPATEAAAHAALSETLAPTEAEKLLIPALVKAAQAILPVQGHNLIAEGHHYLTGATRSSFRAFKAVESQLWQAPGLKEAMEEDLDEYRDLMWHKSGHPVAVAFKTELAKSTRVAENLRSAGLGAAAARLPVLESEVRAAATYLRLADDVNVTFELFGGYVNTLPLREAIAAVHGLSELDREPELVFSVLPLGGDKNEPLVDLSTRTEAVRYLKSLIDKITPSMARLLGFYKEQAETASTMGPGGSYNSLTRAYSISRLESDHSSSVSMGRELYKDYKAARAAQRAGGEFVAPKVELI